MLYSILQYYHNIMDINLQNKHRISILVHISRSLFIIYNRSIARKRYKRNKIQNFAGKHLEASTPRQF